MIGPVSGPPRYSVPWSDSGSSSFVGRPGTSSVTEPIFEAADIAVLETLIRKHVGYTGSPLGGRILDSWPQSLRSFVKIFPLEYKRVLHSDQPAGRKIPALLPAPIPAAIVAGGTR